MTATEALEIYNGIGARLAGDDLGDAGVAIEHMITFSKKLTSLPIETQREFLVELFDETWGGFEDGDAEGWNDAVDQVWGYYPRWDGAGAESLNHLKKPE